MRAVARKGLYDLLLELFPATIALYHSLNQHEELQPIVQHLPSGDAPPVTVVDATIMEVLRRGLLDTLLAHLLATVPRRRGDIERVQQVCAEHDSATGGEPAALSAYRRWLAARPPEPRTFGLLSGEVYVPLRAIHHVASPSADEGLEAQEFSIAGLFRAVNTRHCVLLGEPGAGKTRTLRQLFHTCLQDPVRMGLTPGTVPVMLHLRRFTAAWLAHPLPRWLSGESSEADALPPELAAGLWDHGRLLVLADGLDERSGEGQSADLGKHLSVRLTAAGEHVRAAVACRHAGYQDEFAGDPDFTTLALRPLQPPDIRELVRQWFAQAMTGPHSVDPADALVRRDRLLAALDGSLGATQRVMISTPLLLTLLCVLAHEGLPLPRGRAEYYERCLDALLQRRAHARDGRAAPLSTAQARAVLRPLAHELHVAGKHESLVRGALARRLTRELRRLDRTIDAFEVVGWLERDAGVLQEQRPGCLTFAHLGLQEYLAATHIAAAGDQLVEALADRLHDPWWHEVARLVAGQRGSYAPLMRGLLRRPIDQGELIADLLIESPEAEPSPLLERLTQPCEPAETAVLLRMLARFAGHPAVAAKASELRDHPFTEIGALARRLTDARGVGADDGEVVLVFAPNDRAQAEAFARSLRDRGIRLFAGDDRLPDAVALNQRLGVAARTVACAVALHHRPDSHVQGCLGYLVELGLAVACVPVPGAAAPAWPADLGLVPAFALTDGLDALCAWLSTQHRRDVACVTGGEAFTDTWTETRFLPVPGQEFMLGMQGLAEPVHRVALQSYWLAEVPVTNAQYAKFLTANSDQPEPLYWRERRFSGPEQPVVGVAWADAVRFCAWLSRCPGLADVVDVRLPTEAQWELAARGPKGLCYPWGDDSPDRTRAVYGRQKGTAPVGSCPAGKGPFGHLDLVGNVWELCCDGWLHDAYTQRSDAVTREPEGPREGEHRVVRGDSWFGDGSCLPAAIRRATPSLYRDAFVGFRPAAVLLRP